MVAGAVKILAGLGHKKSLRQLVYSGHRLLSYSVTDLVFYRFVVIGTLNFVRFCSFSDAVALV